MHTLNLRKKIARRHGIFYRQILEDHIRDKLGQRIVKDNCYKIDPPSNFSSSLI